MTPEELRQAKYTRIQRRRRAAIADGTWRYRIPAEVAIEHVRRLRAAGMSAAAIAAAAGLPLSTVSPLAWPNGAEAPQFVSPDTADALLAVQGPHQAPEWAWVPNVATRRRIEALQCMGWSLGEIGRRLGVSRQAVGQCRRRDRVQVGHAARIAAVFDELAMRPGPDMKTRAWAAKSGYAPPLAWDDDAIDDPKAKPYGVSRRHHRQAPVVDEVAIARALDGDRVALTKDERLVVVEQLAAEGLSDAQIADRVGVTDRTVFRDRDENRIPSRWVA